MYGIFYAHLRGKVKMNQLVNEGLQVLFMVYGISSKHLISTSSTQLAKSELNQLHCLKGGLPLYNYNGMLRVHKGQV